MNASIVIVEDEGIIALGLKERLEQSGYSVLAIVDNADDALASIDNLRPSLVLMDIHLRGVMDGVETAARIRREFHIPVIFATAHADRETLDRARITEPFGYIVKPFHGVDFRAQIEIALWKHDMEQRLRVTEAWISMTFRNVADALIATDELGNVALMNEPASRLTGWDADAAKGRPLSDVFLVSDEITGIPAPPSLFEGFAYSDGGTAAPRTFTLTRYGSEPIVIEAEISANRDAGRTFGVIVVFRDITGRRKAERQERQLQKMNALGLMATGLGRELAESQSRMDESVKELIEQAKGSTLRLLWDIYERSSQQQAIVQQLITLGRTDAGQAVILDLNRALADLREPMKKALGPHRVLSLKLQPGIPPIQADPRHLRENLLRLIADVRQSTARGSSVEISTQTVEIRDDRISVQLAVRDERKVLANSAKERVFDPYYQSHTGKGNPGFSLALVCQFVALNGGSIDVEATPGAGSAYLLNFPAVRIAPAVAPAPEEFLEPAMA